MIIIGNEYGAADFQPHLIPAIVYERKIDLATGTATDKTVVVAGGYHPKMRLRYGYAITVDEDVVCTSTAGAFNVLHGSSEVVAAAVLTTSDVIGTVDEVTIVDQYKDVAAADQIAIEKDAICAGGSVAGIVIIHLEYELVE